MDNDLCYADISSEERNVGSKTGRNKIFILGYNSAENSNDLGEKGREAYVISDATFEQVAQPAI